MGGLNKVLLIGHVGGNPEIRVLPNGGKVAIFSLASSENYTDKSGQKITHTEWHKIELWDVLAGVCEKHVKKGDQVFVEGKIRNEKWIDSKGIEKSSVRIRGTAFQLLNSGNTPSKKENTGLELPKLGDEFIQDEKEEDDLPF